MGKVALKTVLKNFLNHFETLESRRKSNSEDDLYHKEFQSLKELTESLKKDPDYSCSKGLEDVNIRKNRYKDILPYDYSRVILSDYPGIPGSEYINANYIKGSSGNSCYIASQGPLPCTVVDFYRMIWECDVTVIVMACNETESGRFKCECYWPQTTDQEQQYGNIAVSLVKWKQVCPDFLVRTLKIRANDEERVVCQFHYLTWPDHSIPPSVSPILELVRLIRDVQSTEARPILVHCSAGCGRTGTICTIDYVWALLRTGKLKLKEDFSLYSIISDMRRQRIAMVQTKEQYILCYRAVATLFEQQLKMIDAHIYVNLNEDGEPLMNSENEEDEEQEEDDEEGAEREAAEDDAVDNQKTTAASSERESESLTNSEEESYCRTQPDLIQTRHKKRSNHFGSLRASRLHKSTPDFELDFGGQPLTNESSEMNNSSKNETKLVGKATVIRRSSRPSIAHLKAMFENMNLPNPDGFVNSYSGRNNKGKPSLLKRSMSTREKVGSFNTWSSNHLNVFGQHGSFENLNWKEKNLYSNDSNDSETEEPMKADQNAFYGADPVHNTDNRFNPVEPCNQFSEPCEPIYGFKQQAPEIDKSYIIENVADLPPPPKPPRQFTYQQNEEPFEPPPPSQVIAESFRSSADTMLNNRSLNSSHAIDYNLPSYLTNKLSASKNYYNTIGPIKHREPRPPMLYCFNDTANYPKASAAAAYSQSKSTYNIATLQPAKESQPGGDLFEAPMSRSKSINELSNNIYELPSQRFGVLPGHYTKSPMPMSAAPLPNHLIKPNIASSNLQMANHVNGNMPNGMSNGMPNGMSNGMPMNCYQHEPQDFYGYIGMNNVNNVNTNVNNHVNNNVNSHLNNMSNNVNSLNKPILPQPNMNRAGYPLPTLPKPNMQQFSNTLPAHYTTQISLSSQHQQQQQQHQQQHQQQYQQQPTYGQLPPKVQPPMSYVKPTMRNTSAINMQQQNGNFRNQQQQLSALNNPNNNMSNMNKHISSGNLPNGLMNGSTMNGNVMNGGGMNGNAMNSNVMNGNAMNNSALNGNLNGTLPSMCPTPNPNGLTNSTSAVTLGSKNYYQPPPSSFSQSKLMHMNQQRKENNCQTSLNDKVITVKDDSSSAHNGVANGHPAKPDKLSGKEKVNGHRQGDKYDQGTIGKSNEAPVVKTKKKSSAFNTLSSIFGLGKRKKDSKKANGSTTNLNAISVSNGTAANGTNLMRPPHFHRFAQEAQWTQV